MQKFYIFLACLFVFLGRLYSFSIEGRVLGFRPNEGFLRDIYGSSWVDYQLEVSQSLVPSSELWKRLNIFASSDYLSKNGKTVNGGNATNIRLIPVTVGLKWVQPINRHVDFYWGAAPRYSFLRVKDSSPFVRRRTTKSDFGGYITAGSNFHPTPHILLDVALGYAFQWFSAPKTPPRVEGHGLNISGFYFGGGFGFIF